MGFITAPLADWLRHETPAREFPLSDFERIRYELKPCDIILIEGRSRVSEVIKLITQSPWSHAALYLGRLHDIEDAGLREKINQHFVSDQQHQLIIESQLGVGTVVRPLQCYEHDHIRICRPRGISFKDSQAVLAYAIDHLGLQYNVRQIFDLARFLFPWFIMPRRWRSSLFQTNVGDNTKTVCSTMIAEAFHSVQFPILPLIKKTSDKGVQLFRRNPRLCTPSDFDYSPYFEIIKYPFLDFHQHTEYRLLPWDGQGHLNPDEAHLYIDDNAPAPGDTKNLDTSEDTGEVEAEIAESENVKTRQVEREDAKTKQKEEQSDVASRSVSGTQLKNSRQPAEVNVEPSPYED